MRTVVFAIVFALPLAAAAQPGPGPHGWRGGPGGCPCVEGPGCPCHGGPGRGPGMHMFGVYRCVMESPEIGLSADQRRQIEAIRDEVMADIRANRPKVTRADFIRAFADPKVSNADLKKMADTMHAERKALMDRKWDAVMRVRQVLTPEQLARIPTACRPPLPEPDFPED